MKKIEVIAGNKPLIEKYVAPTFEVAFVKMEEGIAAGSSRINVGTASDSTTPKVDTWETGWNGNRDFDL